MTSTLGFNWAMFALALSERRERPEPQPRHSCESEVRKIDWGGGMKIAPAFSTGPL